MKSSLQGFYIVRSGQRICLSENVHEARYDAERISREKGVGFDMFNQGGQCLGDVRPSTGLNIAKWASGKYGLR